MKRISVLTLIALVATGIAVGQTDSLHEAPRDSAPAMTAAPPPPSQRVLELTETLMPGGRATTWRPCKSNGAAGWGCDSVVKQLRFDPAAMLVRALPCATADLQSTMSFRIEEKNREVLLTLHAVDRKYIIAKPNRCGNSCPGQSSCLRLTVKRERRSANEDIYLYKDTIH